MTATEWVTGMVTAGPGKAGVARVWVRSLVEVVLRRPAVPGVRHSAGVRQLVLPLVAIEIVTSFLVSSMIPPPLRPAHAALEVLLITGGLALVAALVRHPHQVDGERLVLRTGFLGEVTLPRSAVRSVAPVIRTVGGRGPRPVPEEPEAVACSVGGSLDVAVRLDPPVRLDLGAAGVVDARTVYASADSLPALSAALRAA
ncbi:hypothetical protein [Streptomyces sp. C]|uniref:hypothetical protein n=1 Tax=Streptomyces sp. C TaxID=253839 RepID=UPI0001B54D48|nr:hypothetical protein [Streptomyces sp. C]